MFEIAKVYHVTGFTPIPVAPREKRPVCEWLQWMHRRPTWEEIEAIWREAIERFGDELNIATILGRAHGIVALDIDEPERFRQARIAVGLSEEDLLTWTQKSARGGALFFRYPEHADIRRLRNEHWGAELRGDGCIQVLPPSVHPSGARYEWLKSRSPDECELANLPDIILEAFVRCDDAKPLTDEVSLTDKVGATDWEKSLVSLLVPLWVQGVRHDAALALAGLMAKKGVPKERAMAVLDSIAEAAGDEEWKDRRRACSDTYQRVAEGKEVIGFMQLANLLGESVAKAIDVLVPDLRPNPQLQQPKSSRSIPILTPIAEEDATEPDWVWEGVLPQGSLALLGGLPKAGKSFTALNLAAAIADGQEFLGRATKQQRVLVLAFERRKSWAMRAKRLGLTGHPNLLLWRPQQHGPLPTIADLEFFREVVKVNNVQVVIVDQLGHFLAPLERYAIANAGYTQIIAELQRLKDEILEPLGVTFIGVHHFNKSEQGDLLRRFLGSIGYAGSPDVLLGLEVDGETFHLQVLGNDVDRSDFWFVFDDDGRVVPTEKPEEPTKEVRIARLMRDLLAEHKVLPRKQLFALTKEQYREIYGEDIGERTLVRALERAREYKVRQLKRGYYTLGDGETEDTEIVPPYTYTPGTNDTFAEKPNKTWQNFVPSGLAQSWHNGTTDPEIVPSRHEYIGGTMAQTPDPHRCPRCGDLLVLVGDEAVCLTCLQENPEPPDNPPTPSSNDKSSENSDNFVSARSRSKRLVDTERWLASLTSDGLVSPSASVAHSGARSGASPPASDGLASLEAADMFPF